MVDEYAGEQLMARHSQVGLPSSRSVRACAGVSETLNISEVRLGTTMQRYCIQHERGLHRTKQQFYALLSKNGSIVCTPVRAESIRDGPSKA